MSLSAFFSRRSFVRAASAAGLALTSTARGDEPPKAKVPPEAKKADVESLDAIVAALYDVISGAKGQARDWDRFRSLFVPGARLIPCTPKDQSGKVSTRVLTPEDFIGRVTPAVEKRGFFESEIGRRVEKFGHIAQVFSSYESREEKGAEPFARGINSFQLLWDETRWWVVTIYWDSETPTTKIPAEYIGKP